MILKVNKRFLSFLGLAAGARLIASGTMAAEDAVKKRKASLLVVESGLSARTISDWQNKAAHYGVPICVLDTEDLGQSIGQPARRVAAVLDKNFSRKMQAELDLVNNNGGSVNE